jgi:hypothetical protein
MATGAGVTVLIVGTRMKSAQGAADGGRSASVQPGTQAADPLALIRHQRAMASIALPAQVPEGRADVRVAILSTNIGRDLARHHALIDRLEIDVFPCSTRPRNAGLRTLLEPSEASARAHGWPPRSRPIDGVEASADQVGPADAAIAATVDDLGGPRRSEDL